MSATRTASAHWEGDLFTGNGQVSLESSGIGTYDVTWAARTEQPGGKTSPEELIAAAHSSCYSMALSHELAQAGTPPQSVVTKADVTFQPGEGITGIVLSVQAQVPGVSAEDFQKAAQAAKTGCPVSKALSGTTITLNAELVG